MYVMLKVNQKGHFLSIYTIQTALMLKYFLVISFFFVPKGEKDVKVLNGIM